MVLVGFTSMFFTFGAPTLLPPLIYGPVIDEFGWNRTEATLFASYKFAASAIGALLLIGYLIDRFGLRTVIVFANLGVGVGMLSFLWVDTKLAYYAFGALLGFSGTSMMVSVKVLVSRWFTRNQGVAMGVMLSGSSAAGVLIPILGEILIQAYDWRIAMAAMSIGVWLVALPLYLWKARENPSEEDTLPQTAQADDDPILAERIKGAEVGGQFSDILKTKMFWLIAGSLFLVGTVDHGMLQHTVLYLDRDLGMGSMVAAVGLSGTFALGIVAKIGSGWVYDRLSIRGIQLCYILLALSIVLALPVSGAFTLMLFVIVRGLAHGGLIADSAIFAKHCYGNRHLNKAMSVLVGSTLVGFAAGPAILGALYDYFGSYTIGFFIFIALALLATVMLVWVRPIHRDRVDEIARDHRSSKKEAIGLLQP